MVIPGVALSGGVDKINLAILLADANKSDAHSAEGGMAGGPLNLFIAEHFLMASEDTRLNSLHRAGFRDGAYEVAVDDSPEARQLVAALTSLSESGWWSPERGDKELQYHDVRQVHLLFAPGQVALHKKCERLGAGPRVPEREVAPD